MAKPLLAATVVSPSVTVRSSDSSASVLVDTATGVHVTTSGNGILVDIPSIGSFVELSAGGTLSAVNTNGNVQVIAGNSLVLRGFHVEQTMLTLTDVATLDPAAAVYNELNNNDVAELITASRLNVAPPAGGTVINSMFVQQGNPNPDGRVFLIQNTSSTDPVTLANLAAGGTDGGKFFGPGDYVIPGGPGGGGAVVEFDEDGGVWFVRGI